MRVEFPEKLRFLTESHQHAGPCGNQCGRYKVPYGGRGGLKSWACADAALLRGAKQFERILCARETMDSLKQSVHHLLEQRIYALGLKGVYDIQQSAIYGPTFEGYGRTEFLFAGLQHNVRNIKSLEGVTIVWVEEAQAVSKDSWDTLIPTIRWEDKVTGRKSEIWAPFNPRLVTDETYKRFVLDPPATAIICKTNYHDNPWFPEVLRADMEDARTKDEDDYRHIWLGEPIQQLKDAIFGAEMKATDASNRICSVPIDRTKPVETFWDLGFGDKTAIWFAQAYGGWYNLIDYVEDNGRTVADWIVVLQSRGYIYGQHWLPHDAVDAMLHHRMTGDKTRSVEMLMRAAGMNVRVAPKMAKFDRINAARTIFSQCRFDRDKCADGLQGLRLYRWGPPNANGEARREPLHDAASHPADGFCTLAVAIKQPAEVRPRQEQNYQEEYSWQG